MIWLAWSPCTRIRHALARYFTPRFAYYRCYNQQLWSEKLFLLFCFLPNFDFSVVSNSDSTYCKPALGDIIPAMIHGHARGKIAQGGKIHPSWNQSLLLQLGSKDVGHIIILVRLTNLSKKKKGKRLMCVSAGSIVLS